MVAGALICAQALLGGKGSHTIPVLRWWVLQIMFATLYIKTARLLLAALI
jgi:hypothetical protein